MIRLKYALVLLAASSYFPSATFAQQQVLEFAENGRSVISISGEGEVSKAPNVAVQDARRKAALYAGAADMKVARILVIDDGSASSYGGPSNQFGFFEAMEPTPLAKGEITVSQSVNIIFELEPK